MSAHQPDEVVRMKLPCRDSAQFLSEFAPKMSSRIFVPMEAPPAAGAVITLHIKFQDGEVHVKGRAAILKAVATPRSGVHVRFTSLDADSLQFALSKGTTGQTAALVRDEHTSTGETYIPPEAVPLPGASDVTTPGSPVPLPGASPALAIAPGAPVPLPAPRPSSPAFVPYVPKPAPSAPAPFVPFVPKPSSPKPASSLLSDAPPPKPSSPKPASSLLSDAPPPKPSAPKPVSSLLSDAPPPAAPAAQSAPDPFELLSAASTSKVPAHAGPSGEAVTHVTAAPPAPAPSTRAAPPASVVAPPASAPSTRAEEAPPPTAVVEPEPIAPPRAEVTRVSEVPPPRDARPLDAPPRPEKKPRHKPPRQEEDDEPLAPPSKSRAPLMVGLGLGALLLGGGGLFLAFGGPAGAKATPKLAASPRQQAVVDLLKRMDEQMMAGRYAGPGGDTALDSLQVALATAPDNARVKEYQEKLATFFERRAAEAIAKSDHAEAAVQLIALNLADPKRAGVQERLLAEEAQVKNQARK